MTTPDTPDYRSDTLGGVLDAIASDRPAPGGGAVAAMTVAMAAALATMVARCSRAALPDADGAIQRAQLLRDQVAPLADDDAAAYGRLLAALRAARKAASGAGDAPSAASEAVHDAFVAATDVPLKVAELGAATAVLAASLAVEGNPNLRGDAATAVLLADAGVRAAATLVGINVEQAGLAPDNVERARDLVRVAARSVARLDGPPDSSAP